LAAWYSKARNAARVEVHVCRAAREKVARRPAGQVQIARFKCCASRQRRLLDAPEED